MTFKKTILENGLRVIMIPMAENPSVTVLVMVQAGSKYETKEESGLSHFLEHMVFKGSAKRPKPSDISRELESIGAQYNAFTGQEYTGYYAKADVRHAAKVVDVVSDMFLHPVFDQKEMEKEKGVIIEEIRMYNDLPQQRAAELLSELLYGDQPAGWNIAGNEQTVRSFTREALMSYRTSAYTYPATTIVVSGSFKEDEMNDLIVKAFVGNPDKKTKSKLPVKEGQPSPRILTSFKETDQTHLAIGFRTFSILDPRIPTMNVLSTILGRGMSSRLFLKMREELGICYYIRAEHEPLTDHGYLNVSAGVDNSRVEEGIKGILGECIRLKDEVVSEVELQKAKDYIAGTTMLSLETSDARAEFCGYQEILKGRVDLPETLIARVRAVTAQDVQNLAKDIFKDSSMNMVVVGKFKDDSTFKSYFTLGHL